MWRWSVSGNVAVERFWKCGGGAQRCSGAAASRGFGGGSWQLGWPGDCVRRNEGGGIGVSEQRRERCKMARLYAGDLVRARLAGAFGYPPRVFVGVPVLVTLPLQKEYVLLTR